MAGPKPKNPGVKWMAICGHKDCNQTFMSRVSQHDANQKRNTHETKVHGKKQ